PSSWPDVAGPRGLEGARLPARWGLARRRYRPRGRDPQGTHRLQRGRGGLVLGRDGERARAAGPRPRARNAPAHAAAVKGGEMPNVHVTAERWRDPQYAAAFYVFSRMRFSDKRRACFARVESAGIDKAGLLEEARAWSHGERVLVKIALDLFDPGCVAAAG